MGPVTAKKWIIIQAIIFKINSFQGQLFYTNVFWCSSSTKYSNFYYFLENFELIFVFIKGGVLREIQKFSRNSNNSPTIYIEEIFLHFSKLLHYQIQIVLTTVCILLVYGMSSLLHRLPSQIAQSYVPPSPYCQHSLQSNWSQIPLLDVAIQL